MPVHRGNIGEIIIDAWDAAKSKGSQTEGDHTKETNKEKSNAWIDSLATRFQQEYKDKRHYAVFWAGNDKNWGEFKRNEYLYDISVCTVSDTKSLESPPRALKFIARCHWQVESEFNRANTREIIIDMSKLVMGAAENKLFIASHRSKEQELLKLCSKVVTHCSGHFYFCFLAHPDDWGGPKLPPPPCLYEWLAGGWVKIELPQKPACKYQP